MKKCLLLIVALAFIFCLSSCGEKADKPPVNVDFDNWTEQDFENALAALDAAETSAAAQNKEEPAKTPHITYEPKQEILDAEWDSGLVQVNDKLVQLPIRLSDWLALGFDYKIGYEGKPKDYLFGERDGFSVYMMVDGTDICYVSCQKTTEGFETVEDIDPYLYCMDCKPQDNVTLYFPGGLTFGDPYESIEEKLGPPKKINENMIYEYGDTNIFQGSTAYGLDIWVNRETHEIGSFVITKNLDACSWEDLTTITLENVENKHSSDIHTLSFLWTLEGDKNEPQNMERVFLRDGKRYLLDLTCYMRLQKYESNSGLFDYRELLLDETDETGMRRRLYYDAGDGWPKYDIVCTKDGFIMEGSFRAEDLMNPDEPVVRELEDLAMEIARSVQY